MNDFEYLNKIKEFIKIETGILINDERLIDLEIVVKNRLIFHKLTLVQYLDFIKKNYDELILLASCFTIQETSFYRYKSHFDRLKKEIIPEIIERNKDEKTINILSAGCATGEEPYTIAMILNEMLGFNKEWIIRITATDINKNALDIAKNGVYSEYKMRNIDSSYISRYFDISDNVNYKTYNIKEHIKKTVTFRHYNLIKEPFSLSAQNSLDLIFCENVIIYFCLESIQRLINNFYVSLKDNGYLFLGYSETLNLFKHDFILSWWNDSYVYKKSNSNNYDIASFQNEKPKTFNLNDNIFEDFQGISENSYKEFISIIMKNYKEDNFENVKYLIQMVEKSKIKHDEVFYIIKAEFLYDNIDYMNSANECRKAISINPHFIDAHIILGMVYLELNMLDSAVFEIRTALYIDNDSIMANYSYAMFNKKIENMEDFKVYNANASRILKENGGLMKNAIYPINEKTRKKIYENMSNLKNHILC
jgi:chemotaxis protein methyltransferase CheR